MPADVDPGYSEARNRSVVLTAVFYILMVIFVPMVSYSFTKSIIFDGLLGLDNSTSTTAAAITAVVGVHVVLVFFIIAAYREDKRLLPSKRD